jgi:DNA-binding SARP family transcriptional activator
MTNFKLLGVFEVTSGADGTLDASRNVTPTAPKLRGVLALLLLQANRVVHVDTIIEELWGPNPPRSAVTIVQTYIYHLRKVFAAEKLDPPGKPLLATRPPGYLLHAEPEQVDAEVFERLVQEGRDLKEKDRPRQAAATLSRALGMWVGPALDGVPQGRLLQAHVVHLEELRINALEMRIQADITLGKHGELIAELRSLTCAYPFHEWFHGQLISVLSRSGRRSEALQAYQSLRALLSEELGVDPSPGLQRLQQHVLTLGAPDRCPPLKHGRNKPLGLAS